MKHALRSPVLSALVAAVFTAIVVGGIAIAQADPETSFTGCLNAGGNINQVAIGSEPRQPCRGQSTQISWNQTGPPGAQGAQGPAGPAGPPGGPSDGLSCANQEAIKSSIPAFDVSDSCKLDTFAIAYINVDGIDGFTEGVDILIAKAIDGPNNDGQPGPGDLVVTDRYPLDRSGTTAGQFQVTSHNVGCGVPTSGSPTLECHDGAGSVFTFGSGNGETYVETSPSGGGQTLIWDNGAGPFGPVDWVSIAGGSPSSPAAVPSADFAEDPGDVDHIFIDVDVFVS